jgi:uncharacterized protein (TIGR00255 family)
MLLSMTGYGEAQRVVSDFRIAVEIFSLNSRFLEIFVTLPEGLESQELELRKRISKAIPRGRITVRIRVEPTGERGGYLNINRAAFLSLLKDLRSLLKEADIPQNFDPAALLRIPGVLNLGWDGPFPEKLQSALWKVLEEAIKKLKRSLREEGKKLEKEILERLDNIKRALREIQKLKKVEMKEERKKLVDVLSLEEGDSVDEERLLQMLSRFDISEEITRLKSHMKAIEKVIKSRSSPKGRKLEFYCQELHREATTLSHKSILPKIVDLSVEMREEIERIREQVRNIQ